MSLHDPVETDPEREAASGPVFTPPCGPVRGWNDGPVVRATGIRYATAGRFEPPVAAADRNEELVATAWSPACPQAPVPFLDEVLGKSASERRFDEDCQHLSVTLPAGLGPEETLPVMVWIHGGSYVSGAGDLPIMDPAALVAEQRVIVVTVTYRLGLFGFLGGTPGHPANLGLLDIVEAFRWVQRNIRAFGGDPREVTAFGQSAGADAVAQLMAVPDAPSLFRRAIIQSAPLGLGRGRAAINAKMAAAAADIGEDLPAEEVVAREASIARLAAGSGLKAGMPFGTQYGHAPLPPEAEIDAVWSRVAPEIDILIGHTAEEARLFVPRIPAIARVAAWPVIGPLIRRGLVSAVTAAVYGRSSRRFARRHARAGGRADRYLISWAAPGNPFGSAHTIDLPLLFGDENTWAQAAIVAGSEWRELDAAARATRALWAAFARGSALPESGRIPGVLRHRAVGRG
ncbi:carboxylesterase family protein [Herbiconiux sp. 11R-BC]|uniref:carboxylesterase family protein n=1 Tax=Herbiconiux sp. 11R-BC TaxID=3111637 RepID=UPI003C01AF69